MRTTRKNNWIGHILCRNIIEWKKGGRITLKRNINIQTDNNWWYKTIMLTKMKHAVQWGCILSKGQCYWEKQWNMTLTFLSLSCIVLGITVHNLRIEDNYTSVLELMQGLYWGILKTQIMQKLHFLCKKWKTLSEQK